MTPDWLDIFATISVSTGIVCLVIVAIDILAGHRQRMWIMNLVWPITALWSGVFGLYAYFRVGRLSTKRQVERARERGEDPPGKMKPFWQMVALGATHCGAGCTLGDICAEWFVFFVPLTLFGRKVFATWSLDFVVALLFGIAFQYFTIKPMRNLSVADGLKQAVKADVLSLTAWQVGMYGWMAIAIFLIFKDEIAKTNPTFWLMMQIAMVAGFFTSYPVNWWLIRKGIKEPM